MSTSTEDLLKALDQEASNPRRHNNTFEFAQYLEFAPSEQAIPFYIIYWLYKKYCRMKGIRKHKIASKHTLIKTLSIIYKKKYSYPKVKRFNTTVSYELRMYIDSPYLPLSKEEEELAFKYYHFQYKEDRKKRKRAYGKAKKEKE